MPLEKTPQKPLKSACCIPLSIAALTAVPYANRGIVDRTVTAVNDP